MSDRIEILKNSVNNAIRAICPERAILWTEYYKNKLNRNKPVEIGVLGIFPRKRTKASGAPAIPGLPGCITLPNR